MTSLMLRILSIVLMAIAAAQHAAADDGPSNQTSVDSDTKQILMIAGKRSHNYGAHEHYAGLRILKESIEEATDGCKVTVTRGWPDDEALVEAADTIVIYCDGGRRHLAIPKRDALAKKMADGCGLVCLHYAVEVPLGQPHEDWLAWLGGNFEINYSVNPHWTARFDDLPDHPVTRGVEGFESDDEWYFHLRFNPLAKSILSAVAPEATMRRPDGEHSGNPHVRKSVAAGEKQTVAWTFDRPDGGRSFGFSGGHHHWNWQHDDIRRLVTNAIRWTAGDNVEESGSAVPSVLFDDLLENQDYDRPNDFDADAIKAKFQLTATGASDGGNVGHAVANAGGAKPRLLDATALIDSTTSRHRVDMTASLDSVEDLYLVVTDGGDGFKCDWADWVDPILTGPKGQISLAELDWMSATTGFGKVHKNGNAVGDQIAIREGPIGDTGIGVHAPSVVHFKVPEGYDSLSVIAGLDVGGTSQQNGEASSVRFLIYADAAPSDLDAVEQRMSSGQRDPANATAGLEIADGLEATLVGSEPQLKSLTNLDVDDRGRIWVCDVMNYRRRNGARPEGDRILILEDTTGDGVADLVKTFYQGNDIDSAMGICVLGNQVIVTATPNVWRFTDDDGDDIPDRKEAMFTDVGQPQHDHSAHSFLFGDDGKLYWNFGNTGQQVKDANGETVVDIHGRPVVDDGKPLFGGMPFRCDMDGSNFEVLAHNFRNNWETTIDSFGTLWQSDNDDDGNRGTRINFVMEQGNYGYKDELTGASWKADRITMEETIPLQHWHLNDPGVVPNVLQTGAGSPCGICVYEGRLLPERFWDQVIHCDPGPNVVRAYPMTPQGAGYSATIEPLMTGTIDKWFRPADVCVAPDGSLFVSDWYDPGVGGHRQEDSDRGRLFRLAPPGTQYTIPQYDYSTAVGAVAALRNPNRSVRYKAWTALHGMGRDAEPALLEMYADPNPRMRARALWLLGKIPGRGQHYVQLAIADDNIDIRITGMRLARQLGMTPSVVLASLANDSSSAVRRELAVALRFDESPTMPGVFAKLAAQYDGKDRWMLEAIGIASDERPEECFAAWLDASGGVWDTPKGRDLVWRIRSPQAAPLLVQIIQDPKLKLEDTNRYFRSLEYHPADIRTAALKQLLP